MASVAFPSFRRHSLDTVSPMTELRKARRAEADRGLETILHRANEKPRALQLAAKTGGVYFNEKMNEKSPLRARP
jgi:hypothetical protein